MKTTFLNKIKKLVAGLLVILMGMLIVNNVVFIHAHKLSNGKILIHAHPYNKSKDPAPLKKHSHTVNGLFQISYFQLLFFVPLLRIINILQEKHTNKFFYKTHSVHPIFYFRLKGRDPPFLSC
jgi:hypothetical protein